MLRDAIFIYLFLYSWRSCHFYYYNQPAQRANCVLYKYLIHFYARMHDIHFVISLHANARVYSNLWFKLLCASNLYSLFLYLRVRAEREKEMKNAQTLFISAARKRKRKIQIKGKQDAEFSFSAARQPLIAFARQSSGAAKTTRRFRQLPPLILILRQQISNCVNFHPQSTFFAEKSDKIIFGFL